MRRGLIGAVVAAVAVGGLAPATAVAARGANNQFTVAVYGDAPYGSSQTSPPNTAQYDSSPGFIDTMSNDSSVSLVAQVGDIHSGKEFCTQAYDSKIKTVWQNFKKPLVYTPGDNEWSDCHKPGEGGGKWTTATDGTQFIDFNCSGCFGDVDYAHGNPVDNLALVRSRFFPAPGTSLGGSPIKVTTQAKAYDRTFPTDKNYVENVMWENKDIMFTTLNLPDNPLQQGAPCTMENAATATETSCAQAATDNPTLPITADAWQNHPSYNVPNFHRVTVHGSSSLEWLKLTIDPNVNKATTSTAFGPFSWERRPYTP